MWTLKATMLCSRRCCKTKFRAQQHCGRCKQRCSVAVVVATSIWERFTLQTQFTIQTQFSLASSLYRRNSECKGLYSECINTHDHHFPRRLHSASSESDPVCIVHEAAPPISSIPNPSECTKNCRTMHLETIARTCLPTLIDHANKTEHTPHKYVQIPNAMMPRLW